MSRDVLGIIVDGPGDFAAIKRRFPSSRKTPIHLAVTTGPRGHCVSIDQMVAGAGTQVAILKASGCTKVVLLFDFEERKSSYDRFVRDMQLAVDERGFGCEVVVASPNRMIENWYLADIELLSKRRAYLRDRIRQKNYEGRNGKVELKRLFKAGIAYSETRHGPELFQLIRTAVARSNSSSFDHFMRMIEKRPQRRRTAHASSALGRR